MDTIKDWNSSLAEHLRDGAVCQNHEVLNHLLASSLSHLDDFCRDIFLIEMELQLSGIQFHRTL